MNKHWGFTELHLVTLAWDLWLYIIQNNSESTFLYFNGIISVLQIEDRIQSTHLREYLDENTTIPGFPDHRVFTPNTVVS